MRKILLIVLCAFSSVAFVSAQDVFKKGDKVLNIGIGIGNTLHTGTGFSTKIPPISGSFEFCVIDQLFDDKSSLGVGAFVGYASSEYKVLYLKSKYSDVILGARGAVHYQLVDKLDTYAGLSLGYDIVSGGFSGSNFDYSATSSSVDFGAFFGARYYFSDSFAGMAELGYDIAVFKIGIACKF